MDMNTSRHESYIVVYQLVLSHLLGHCVKKSNH
jgi:hypothetical protein